MDSLAFRLVLFGILAATANVIGGLVLFPAGLHARYRSAVRYLLGIGAGFMLAVTFFEIIPKTVSAWQAAHPSG